MDGFAIQRVKDSANIVDVLLELGYDLQKKGTEYQCLCPFHSDRHLGSFVVSPRKNIYHCFSCNEHGDSITFLMKKVGLSYLDAIRWLAQKYGIEVEGAERFKQSVRPSPPRQPLPPLPMLQIPLSHLKHTRQHLDNDVLVSWLKSLPWSEEQRARIDTVLKNYLVGTVQDGSGFTIFWQVDEQGRVRTGKMMRYKSDGHRNKEIKYNSDWIHARLRKRGFWDPEKMDYETCFYGQHLLNLFPNATVNIVESEKTALIMSIAYGMPDRFLWLACGGKGYLSRENLKPFIDQKRYIVLYPDRDAISEWKSAAKLIGYEHLSVNTDIVLKHWKEEDGPKADCADIILRTITEKHPSPAKLHTQKPPQRVGDVLKDMMERYEAVRELVKTFDLQQTNGRNQSEKR